MSVQVPKGYKQTEVGVIPEDWAVTSVEELVKFEILDKPMDGNHGELHPKKSDFVNFGIPFIMANDVVNGKIDFNKCVFITDSQARKLRKGFSKKGDVLLTHKATIGNSAVVKEDEFEYFMLTPQVTYYRVLKKDRLNNLYLKNYFDGQCFQDILKNNSGGGTRAYIGITAQLKLPIVLPSSFAEQQAIAEALSDADALIESLEQLIAKKRQIKQGAMQELLTGQRRLPGFSGEWVRKQLPEIAWFQEGPGVRVWQFTRSGIKLLNGTNIFNGSLYLEATNRFISENEAYGVYSHFLADADDIVIASSGISIDRFHEKVAVVKEQDLPFCMNTSTIRFKANEKLITKDYLFHLLRGDELKKYLGGQATGSAQLNFGPSHLNKFEVLLPDMAEQHAIAEFLSDLDSEIETLDKQLAKARQIKQSMMQELLTGRIRLI